MGISNLYPSIVDNIYTGLMMGTRSGDVDPAAALHIPTKKGTIYVEYCFLFFILTYCCILFKSILLFPR